MQQATAWRGSELVRSTDWQYRLSTREVGEVERALEHFRARGIGFLEATHKDFPLGALGTTLRQLIEFVERQYGFVILRGLPVQNKTEADVAAMLWGVGLHMGVAFPQNAKAEMIVSVRDERRTHPSARSYASSEGIEFHVDPCDIVALLCRRAAAHGGLSLIASALAVHDEIARRAPELLQVLYEPFPFVERTSAVERPYYESPVFGHQDQGFTSHFFKRRILAAAQCPGGPRLTRRQQNAIDLVETLCADPQFVFQTALGPGDLQIMSNHLVLHSRTAFRDHAPPSEGRHLYRLWLSTPINRAIPQRFAGAWNGPLGAGALRGGYRGWEFQSLVGAYQARVGRALAKEFRGSGP